MIIKASELGLEVIELEDQVLLVDKRGEVKINDSGHFMCYDFDDPYLVSLSVVTDQDIDHCHQKVITSTKPLEGLPLLVIENEVEIHLKSLGVKTYGGYYEGGFEKGYNKAKETYKFTEDDLKKIAQAAFVVMANPATVIADFDRWFNNRVQSLSKKELWIEVEEILEDNGQTDHTSYPTYVKVPKIVNNQIKAVWK